MGKWHVILALAIVAVAVWVGVLTLSETGRPTDHQVRQACASHEGVAVVNGNANRKYVTCRDGYFRTVR